MLSSILSNASTNVDALNVVICSLIAIVLGLIIALTHKFTSKYTKDYLITIGLLPLFVEIVILLVSGNLGMGVAIAGTFSLIRFRTVPGTSKEIVVVFFAMTVGLCLGVGYIYLAMMVTVLGCLMLILYSKVSLFDIHEEEKYLRITIPEELDYTNTFDEILDKYTTKHVLEKVKTTNLGSMFDLKYRITLKKGMNEKEFIDELRVKNGNLKIIISQQLQDDNL